MLSHRLKQIGYLVRSRPWPLEKPIVIQFPVIDICNSQCQMCKIWENKKSDDILPDQLRLGLRNPLYSEVTSVGLNGGEPTLRKDLGQLAEILFQELPKLQAIALITNGYKYRDIIQRISELSEIIHRYGGRLDVMISLDGYGEVHDRVRGKPGNFIRAGRVLKFLKESGCADNIRIGCTIIKENVYGLHDLFDFCRTEDIYVKYRLGIPHKRLYTENLKEPYSLTSADRYHITEFLEGLLAHYETGENQRFFYRSLIDQIMFSAPRKAGCDWQHRGATITSKGELLYCAVQSPVLGRIQDGNSEKDYFDNEPKLKEIISTKCDDCAHDYVGALPRSYMVRKLAKKALSKFSAVPGARAGFGMMMQQLTKSQYMRRPDSLLRSARALPPPAPVQASQYRYLICGWYGTETLGDKAILGGIIRTIRGMVPGAQFTIVSLHPYVTDRTREQMKELAGAEVVTVEQALTLMSQAKALFFGGGPLMALNQMADMLALFRSARQQKVVTAVLGCGVGPMGRPYHNVDIGRLLQLADIRIYRDEKSKIAASNLGVIQTEKQDFVAEDPAFTWLQQSVREMGELPTPEPGIKRLVLGLREFPAAEYAPEMGAETVRAEVAKFETTLLGAIEALLNAHPDLQIVPLPMCTNHFGADDRWYYRRLFRTRPDLKARMDLSLLNDELAPTEYLKVFATAHAVLAMRYHSLVFALGCGIPAVAIDYTLGRGKVQALAERAGVPACSFLDATTDFLVNALTSVLEGDKKSIAPFALRFEQLVSNQCREALIGGRS